MKPSTIIPALCGLLLPATLPAQAQAAAPSPSPFAKTKCADTTTASGTTTTSVWEGKCIDGIADGFGRLTVTSNSPAYKYYTMSASEGNVVAGVPAGMWCVVNSRTVTGDAGEFVLEERGKCGLSYRPRYGQRLTFRRAADGSWEVAHLGRSDVKSPIRVTRETMDNVVIAHLAPDAPQLPDFPFTTPMLDGLTPGGGATSNGDMLAMADLSGKRIGIVLSNATVAELARFGKQRDTFIKSHGFGQKFAEQAGFSYGGYKVDGTLAGRIAITDPARFVPSLIAILRPLVGPDAQIVAADDLTVLTSGAVDYVIVIDWRFDGGILSPAQVSKVPVCPPTQLEGCPPLFKEHYAGMLIDPKIRVVGLAASDVNETIRRHEKDDYSHWFGNAFGLLWSQDIAFDAADMFAEFARGMPWPKLEPVVRRYAKGEGIPKDGGRATTLLGYGIARGDAGAFRTQGEFYRDGIYPPDTTKMLESFGKAADLGDIGAAVQLFYLHALGTNGVAKSAQLAGQYAERAYALEPTRLTAFIAAMSRQSGWTGPIDLAGALRLYQEAEAKGDKEAAKNISDVRAALAQKSAAEADKKAAADADAAFVASLQTVPTPAALFLQADEAAGRGEIEHARLAFRAILRRFPDSLIAANAATRLSALPPTP